LEKQFGFTEREMRIVPLIAKGMPQKEMADFITISPHTIFWHLKNIRLKMQVRTTGEAAVYLAKFFNS
jgi:DNA-binding CsgD family transcriptional regulator